LPSEHPIQRSGQGIGGGTSLRAAQPSSGDTALATRPSQRLLVDITELDEMTRNNFPINQLQSHQQPSSISRNHGRGHTLPRIQKSQMQVPQQSCCSSRCIPQGARNHGDDEPSAVSAGTIRQFFRYACRGIPWCLFPRLCWGDYPFATSTPSASAA
jgi:hypothetical protein